MNNVTSGAAVGAGSATALFGAMSLNDWAIIIGIICTIGTFGLNWYYKRKEFQLMKVKAHITDEELG